MVKPLQMKTTTLLLMLILIKFSAYAQEERISVVEKKQVVFTVKETPEELQSRNFSFSAFSFEFDYNKNHTKTPIFNRFTDLYFQGSKEYPDENFFSMYVKKQPEQEFNLGTYNYTVKDYADGFSLGKWNSKKGFELDI